MVGDAGGHACGDGMARVDQRGENLQLRIFRQRRDIAAGLSNFCKYWRAFRDAASSPVAVTKDADVFDMKAQLLMLAGGGAAKGGRAHVDAGQDLAEVHGDADDANFGGHCRAP